MKKRFAVKDVEHLGSVYAEGSIEIDDGRHEIVFRAAKKGLFSEKELVLGTLAYSAEVFPQFQGSTLRTDNISVSVLTERDRQAISEILSQPLRELKNKIAQNLSKAAKTMRDMLLARAESLDYMMQLRQNPRKALFDYSPEILSSQDNPIEFTIESQKAKIAASLSLFKEQLFQQQAEGGIKKDMRDDLYAISISIGAAQDAMFLGGGDKLKAAADILQEADLSIPSVSDGSIHSFTETLINEASSKFLPEFADEMLQTT